MGTRHRGGGAPAPDGSSGAPRGARAPARDSSWASSSCGTPDARPPRRSARRLRFGPTLGRRRLVLTGRRLRRRRLGVLQDDRLVVDLVERGQPDGLADLPLDLVADVDVLGEELPGVLSTLSELVALVGEPGAGLLDDLEVDADVEERALLGDALAVHDVELALTERRCNLVLDD